MSQTHAVPTVMTYVFTQVTRNVTQTKVVHTWTKVNI